jgi:hypothetical protein
LLHGLTQTSHKDFEELCSCFQLISLYIAPLYSLVNRSKVTELTATLQTGLGRWGSNKNAALQVSAEWDLADLKGGGGRFMLRVKPRVSAEVSLWAIE